MTPEQLSALKAYILSQPDLAPISSGPGTDYAQIAALLNANASPVTLAWMTAVPANDSDDAPDYSTYDALAAGKRDSWGLFLRRDTRDFTRNKVRKWITDVWGNATANSNAEAILLAGTEKASRAEVAFGGNTKTTGTVSALYRAWQGKISITDVNQAMAS